MSSRREVLIRILALLQGKALIETKNCTLKCLKWHYSTGAINEKCCSVDGGRGICPLFAGDLTAQESPPREFVIQSKKKMLIPRSQPGGGAGRRWN